MPDPCLLLSAFDFDLPPEFIAQAPVTPRDHARLLHVGPELSDRHVYDLPDLLRAGDVLVLNDTKVIPARLYGRRGEVEIEILLHKKQGPQGWLAFARPGKRLKIGDQIVVAPDFSAEVLEKHDDGEILVSFRGAAGLDPGTNPESHESFQKHGIPDQFASAPLQQIVRNDKNILSDERLFSLLEKHGEPPLPPYIRRERNNPEDRARYQTVYAAREGAVAAPTAGLHFTPELFARLAARGIECATVTLHVGAGTFLPVKADYVKDHVMHAEWGEITPGIAGYLNKVRADKRRIVAVGTTSLRLLEAAADAKGELHPFKGETDIFITPGYRFRAADALITNFHLPKSTLFMLVSAFAGLDRMRAAYEHAKTGGYRFYSYGDACLLERTL